MEPSSPLHVIGLSVHAAGDAACVVTTPRRELLEVALSPADLRSLLDACDGRMPERDLVAASPQPDHAREVLDALVEQGCLTRRPPAVGQRHWARWEHLPPKPERPSRAAVLMTGDDALLAPLGAVMARSGLPSPRPRGSLRAADLQGLESRPDLVVCALATPDYAELRRTAHLAFVAGVPWAGFHLDNGVGYLGPLVEPGRTATYEDVLDRRRCATGDPELWAALSEPAVWAPTYLPPAAELDWMVGALVAEVLRWLAGGPCRLLSAEVEADPVDLTLAQHPVLPLPGEAPTPFLAGWEPSPERLVDEHAGPILGFRDTVHHPSVPATLHTVQADVADMSRASRDPWQNDLLCGGTSFSARPEAESAALGEAVERYCANWTRTLPTVRASYEELTGRGERAVDPDTLVLYSERQYATPGFPFQPFTRSLRAHWARGTSLTTGEPTWLPASLVYINWHTDAPEGEPPLNFHNYVGVQAGPSLEFALVSAIEEVIERDAMMTWWSNRHPLPALVLPARLQAIWDGPPAEQGQRAWAIPLDNELGVPVIAGVVEREPDGYLTVGFAARPDPLAATMKAWGEALILQEGSRDLDLPEDECAIRAHLGRHNRSGDYLKPWRADRSYLDAYRDDFHDVVQLLCQQQVNLDPRARKAVSPWVDVPAARPIGEVPALPDRSLATYQHLVEERGFEVLYADLTTPDVAACGLHVVRVLVPGMAPNFPAAFPTWGRRRVQDHASRLGWGPALDEDELNVFPLPYA